MVGMETQNPFPLQNKLRKKWTIGATADAADLGSVFSGFESLIVHQMTPSYKGNYV